MHGMAFSAFPVRPSDPFDGGIVPAPGRLPRSAGWRAQLRQRPGLPCIYMSGYIVDMVTDHGIPGDVEFISKPFPIQARMETPMAYRHSPDGKYRFSLIFAGAADVVEKNRANSSGGGMAGFYQTGADAGRPDIGRGPWKRVHPSRTQVDCETGWGRMALLLVVVAILIVASSVAALRTWTTWEPVPEPASERPAGSP